MNKFLLLLLVVPGLVWAEARQIDDFQWEGVERIVAIGDIHGDLENYMATLEAAGLVNSKGKWTGGKTHMVQVGDIPDRGPDTLEIIDHITKLAKQAKRKGGMVHSLIGNHEAMNMYGDLRYVHEGEFKAFVTRSSSSLRDRYFDLYMKSFQEQDPEGFANLSPDFRDEWNQKHPLGWVEHRQAWDPAWNQNGEYATWVLDKPIAIRVNDAIFLHGGISGFYCQNSLDSMTQKAHASLANFNPQNPGIVEDEFGPLWYRGLSGVEPYAEEATVDAILERHGASHIVVGHTPTSGVILPRYDDRVVMVDTGISRAYGGHVAYLEITPEGLFAGYPKGKLPLPTRDEDTIGYLEQVIAMYPDNPYLKKRLQDMQNPPPETTAAPAGAEADANGADTATAPQKEIPICGISQ